RLQPDTWVVFVWLTGWYNARSHGQKVKVLADMNMWSARVFGLVSVWLENIVIIQAVSEATTKPPQRHKSDPAKKSNQAHQGKSMRRVESLQSEPKLETALPTVHAKDSWRRRCWERNA